MLAMPLLKPLPMTPARREANRRNARQSTGPRSARGQAQSRMNRLTHGGRSALYRGLLGTLSNAPPGAVDQAARAALTPQLAAHPMFAELVEVARQAEIELILETPRRYAREEA